MLLFLLFACFANAEIAPTAYRIELDTQTIVINGTQLDPSSVIHSNVRILYKLPSESVFTLMYQNRAESTTLFWFVIIATLITVASIAIGVGVCVCRRRIHSYVVL